MVVLVTELLEQNSSTLIIELGQLGFVGAYQLAEVISLGKQRVQDGIGFPFGPPSAE